MKINCAKVNQQLCAASSAGTTLALCSTTTSDPRSAEPQEIWYLQPNHRNLRPSFQCSSPHKGTMGKVFAFHTLNHCTRSGRRDKASCQKRRGVWMEVTGSSESEFLQVFSMETQPHPSCAPPASGDCHDFSAHRTHSILLSHFQTFLSLSSNMKGVNRGVSYLVLKLLFSARKKSFPTNITIQ